jgi:predicted phage terminase large subunit-like protein
LSAQAEARNVRVLNRPWAAAFLEELENFPSPGWHDDQVDGAAYAFNKLAQQPARRGALPIGRRYGR